MFKRGGNSGEFRICESEKGPKVARLKMCVSGATESIGKGSRPGIAVVSLYTAVPVSRICSDVKFCGGIGKRLSFHSGCATGSTWASVASLLPITASPSP